VIGWLTWTVVGLSVVLMAVAGLYAVRDRLFDDRLLAVVALLELATLVQAVRGLMTMGTVTNVDERMTFAAYLVSLPLVPLVIGFLALKEKTRWAMAALAVGGFAVAVMSVRCQQIWGLYA
jgi:cephalosporin-C deacetylase-like acetyl esterase